MNDELLAMVEREVLGWDGVSRDPDRTHVALYRFGRRHIGHAHGDGVADLTIPRAVHDELVASGKAEPHRGGFPAVVSYRIRTPADVPGAIELFRANYNRAKELARRRGTRPEEKW